MNLKALPQAIAALIGILTAITIFILVTKYCPYIVLGLILAYLVGLVLYWLYLIFDEYHEAPK